MLQLRISQHHWQVLDEETQHDIKTMATEYASDFGYDFEFEYFWIDFTPEQFLLMNLHHPELLKYFGIR